MTPPPAVLVVLPDYPLPATTGLHLRMVAVLQLLRRIGCAVHVLWFGTEDRLPGSERPGLEWAASVECGGARLEQHHMSASHKLKAKASFAVHGSLGRAADVYPFSMRYDAIDAASVVSARAACVDATWVVLPSQGMHWHRGLPDGCRTIVDAADVLSDVTRDLLDAASGPQRLSLWANHVASRTQESTVLPAVDEVWTTTPAESARFERVAPNTNAVVVPNALDEDENRALAPSTGTTIGFLGTYSYQPNLDAVRVLADNIFPRVLAVRSDARLSVAGRHLNEADGRRWKDRSSVSIEGAVQDVEQWWAQIAVAALPISLRGGVPLKLIEALARGRAVVASSVLVEGLDVVDGRDVLVRDDPAEFAAAIAALLDNDEERHGLERRARAAFERSFSLSAAERELRARSRLCR